MAQAMEKEVPCCIRGYHVYKAIWIAAIGELVTCERTPTNSVDRYAVAVIRNGQYIENFRFANNSFINGEMKIFHNEKMIISVHFNILIVCSQLWKDRFDF